MTNDYSLTFDSNDDLDIHGIIGGLTTTISASTISPTSTIPSITNSVSALVPNAPIGLNHGDVNVITLFKYSFYLYFIFNNNLIDINFKY